jgi:DNA repair protein SbcC/Rad50
MKILAIRGENIASLAEPFELDFVDGELAHSGLFAISGSTGSGKSSLLDAMCLPLFNQTPRLNNKGGAMIGYADSKDGERIGANSVGGLLTHGAGKGFAEVDFRGVDGLRYRARWSIARARGRVDGRLQGEKLELRELDSEQGLGGTKTDTLEVIQEKLGLDFDQFRRAVLLAQGEFAAFLKADYKARGELLEQMTGAEIYAEISRATYRRAKEERAKLEDLHQQIEYLTVLGKQERQVLVAAIEGLANKENASATLVQEIEKESRWYSNDRTLKEKVDQAVSKLQIRFSGWQNHADEGWQAPSIEDEAGIAEFLRQNRKELEHATKLDTQLVGERGKVVDLTTQKGALEQKVLLDQNSQVAAKEKVAATRRKLEEIASWQSENSHLGPLAEDWRLYQSELRAFNKVANDLEQLQADEVALKEKLPDAKQRCTDCAEELVAAKGNLVQAKNTAADAQASVDAVSVEGIQQEQKQAQICKEALRDYANAIEQSEDARVEEEGQRAGAAAAQMAAAQAAEELIEANAKLDQAKDDLRRAEVTLGLKDHRAALVAGEACPLCGSEEHPFADPNSGVVRVLDGQKEAVQKLERLRAELDQERSSQEHAFKTAGLAIDAAVDTQDETKGDATRIVPIWTSAAGEHHQVLPALDVSDALKCVQGMQDGVAARLQIAQGQIGALDKLNETLRKSNSHSGQCQGKVDAAVVNESQAKAAFEALEAELKDVSGKQSTLQGSKEQLQRSLEGVYEGEQWRIRLLADPVQFLHEQQGLVQEWKKSKTDKIDCDTRLPEEQASFKHIEDRLKERSGELLQKEQELESVNVALSKLEDKRAGLFGGEPTESVSEELRGINDLNTQRIERSNNLSAHRKQDAPKRPADELVDLLETENARVKEFRTKLTEKRAEKLSDDRNVKKRKVLGPEMDLQQAASKRWDDLNTLIGQADGSKFRNYAQGLTLRIVLEYANEQLRDLRPRYQLMAVPGRNLDMQIIDHDMADEVRAISTLSGGESFLVSLALALGLAESTGKSTAVESLFIDEGFGTLDSETLEIAIATLDALQASGRTIGVISHVDGLADRLGVQVRVSKLGGGRSRVEVLTPSSNLIGV